MTYLPLIGFLIAVAWIIRQGYVAKKEYLGTRESRAELKQRISEGAEPLKAQKTGQGQSPEPTELAGIGTSRQRESSPKWN
jgi:hypothetical protein